MSAKNVPTRGNPSDSGRPQHKVAPSFGSRIPNRLATSTNAPLENRKNRKISSGRVPKITIGGLEFPLSASFAHSIFRHPEIAPFVSCKTCFFRGETVGETHAQCRRRAPFPETGWPIVALSDRCGEGAPSWERLERRLAEYAEREAAAEAAAGVMWDRETTHAVLLSDQGVAPEEGGDE